jgi:demethylmenaquinone methyltransferase/2-methoxy-6-polyprenyl-1,4-benzoquinol methylase
MAEVLSFGQNGRWRRFMVSRLGTLPAGGRVLDVATGTAGVAVEIARRTPARVVGLDQSPEMLAGGRAAVADAGVSDRVSFVLGQGELLPFPDATFDAVTFTYLLRYVDDPPAALRELTRVLKAGGRLVILEITQPRRPPLSVFYSLWFDRIVPVLGTIAGDRHAYSYLPASVKRFPSPLGLAELMEAAGLERIGYVLLAGGIIAIHSGTRPG